MKEDNLEKIRVRLQVEDLDKESRKDLFNKLQKAGGKVVDLNGGTQERPQEKSFPQSRTTAKASKEHSVRASENVNPFYSEPAAKYQAKNKAPEENKKSKTKRGSYLAYMSSYFTCFMANIFNFPATRFTKKFIDKMHNSAFIENAVLKSMLSPLFSKNDLTAFIDFMAEKEKLIELELAMHAYTLIDESVFYEVTDTSDVAASEDPLKAMYIRMHTFKKYRDHMLVAVNTVADCYKEYYGKSIHENFSEKKVKKIFDSLYNTWYISLEELIYYYWNKFNYKNFYMSFEDYISGTARYHLGAEAEVWRADYLKRKEKERVIEEAKSEFPSVNVEKGVSFINSFVHFDEYWERFDTVNDMRAYLYPDDKIFYAYALYDFFDKEFSLAFNYINFFVVPNGKGGKSTKEPSIALTEKV